MLAAIRAYLRLEIWESCFHQQAGLGQSETCQGLFQKKNWHFQISSYFSANADATSYNCTEAKGPRLNIIRRRPNLCGLGLVWWDMDGYDNSLA